MRMKSKNDQTYPMERTVDLSQVVGQDFGDQIKKIYSQVPLLRLNYQEYTNY